MPVEVALVQRDEVVSLLAALGAAVDMPINPSYQPSVSLLQWTSAILENLLTATRALSELAESSRTEVLPTSPAGDTWAQYRAYLTAVLPKKEDVRSVTTQMGPSSWNVPVPSLNEEHTSATRDYYTRAESILRSYSADPHQAPQSDKAPTVQTLSVPPFLQEHATPQVSGYVRHGKYSTTPIPFHLKVLYDELYEACWTGDNESIQELCLPKHHSEGKEAIQISVQSTFDGLSSFAGSNGMPQSMPSPRLSG